LPLPSRQLAVILPTLPVDVNKIFFGARVELPLSNTIATRVYKDQKPRILHGLARDHHEGVLHADLCSSVAPINSLTSSKIDGGVGLVIENGKKTVENGRK
jgi:hypothetical protein